MAEANILQQKEKLFEKRCSIGDTICDDLGFDPYNLNVSEFNPDLYLCKLLRECSLTQLTQREHEIFRQIQLLDSEMQTLVYENYNKFISATDTIRKMKNDFKKMEEEMDLLSMNMGVITDFSKNISGTLEGRRQKVSNLSGVHGLLKKLQFLFELPPRLKTCIESENYSLAVKEYLKAQKVLLQYEHMPSFHGIQQDCGTIVIDLKVKLRLQFRDKDVTPKQLAVCVDLLLQLGEPTEDLCTEFLEHAKEKLNVDLNELKGIVGIIEKRYSSSEFASKLGFFVDVLQFVDLSYNGFLSNISLVISSYSDLFLHAPPQENSSKSNSTTVSVPELKLKAFVKCLLDTYMEYMEARFSLEKKTNEHSILVRALDRFYRRIESMNNKGRQLLQNIDLSQKVVQIIMNTARDRCHYYLEVLKNQLTTTLINIRENLAAPSVFSQDGSPKLSDHLSFLETSVTDSIKSVLSSLKYFIQSEVSFSSNFVFREPFCHEFVREGVIVSFFHHITDVALEFCSHWNEKSTSQLTPSTAPPPQLILILSRFCMNMHQSNIASLMNLSDECFKVEGERKDNCTSVSDLCLEAKETAQKLINHFVNVQGLNISHMLRKSVETRDWLNAIEPRNVRAVMKRVVEDVTAIDSQVGQLYEEGLRKERSSDSSRRTFPSTGRVHRSKNMYNAYASSTIDNSLLSNIQKLFSERIEIFSSVEFSRVSVLTGVIKISLKTFLECIRVRTFSKYGLQQTQVDTHYLQLYLWHFVTDENIVHALLDEIMGSSINRCIDPVLMEPSVVEVICERG